MRVGCRAWLGACLVVSLGLSAQSLLGAQGWRHRRRLMVELAQVEQDNAALSASNARLQRRLEALQHSPAAQQHAVRDGLGWVRPGEWVVHLPAAAGHPPP